MTRLLDIADPARGGEAGEFQGRLLGAGVSVIVVDPPPGGGPRLRQVDIHVSDHFVTEWLE